MQVTYDEEGNPVDSTCTAICEAHTQSVGAVSVCRMPGAEEVRPVRLPPALPAEATTFRQH